MTQGDWELAQRPESSQAGVFERHSERYVASLEASSSAAEDTGERPSES